MHLTVLWSFAFAKPLFDVLADSPEFFVARGNTTGDVVLCAFGLVLVPPTLLWLVELALTVAPRARDLVHLLFVGALSAAIAIQILKPALPDIVLTLAALAAGAGAAVLYSRARGARSTLTLLAPAPALFLFLFLVTSPVSHLFQSDAAVEVRHDVRPSAPVVVVVFDEFSVETLMDRHLGIDAARFPNFAALAKSATWYRNATTIADHTTDAVPAVLSARYPKKEWLPTAADHPHNLFTLLGGAYSLRNVDEPATDLCPTRLCSEPSRPPVVDRLDSLGKDITIVALHRVSPDGLENRLPAVNQGFGNFAGQGRDAPAGGGEVAVPGTAFADRPGHFDRFVRGIDGEHPHSLNFLHVLLPHTPWQYLPTGQQYPPPGGQEVPGVDGNGVWTKDRALPEQAFRREVLQVGYVDRLVGRLVDRLRATGLYDRALLVITADHGISFRPGTSRRTASGPAAADILGVPLLVKLPGQRHGGIDDRRATTADVLPTIADALGVRLGWRTDGRSLLRPAPTPRAPLSVALFPSRERVTTRFADYVRERDAEVRRMRSREGPGRGWAGIYAMGQDSDLFGRRVAELRTGTSLGARAELDRPASFTSVQTDRGTAPGFVGGRLTGSADAQTRVVVAVNGVVRAATAVYQSDGQTRFGALVPASAFHEGTNDVRIFAIDGAGAARRLRPMSGGSGS